MTLFGFTIPIESHIAWLIGFATLALICDLVLVLDCLARRIEKKRKAFMAPIERRLAEERRFEALDDRLSGSRSFRRGGTPWKIRGPFFFAR